LWPRQSLCVKKLIPTTLTHLEINAFLYLDLLVYQALLCLSVYVIMDLFFFNWWTDSLAYNHFTDNMSFRYLSWNSILCIQDLPSDLKQRNEQKKICTSSLASEFPEDCKFYPADTKDELHKVISPIVSWEFWLYILYFLHQMYAQADNLSLHLSVLY